MYGHLNITKHMSTSSVGLFFLRGWSCRARKSLSFEEADIHYRVHMIPPLISILSQINPVHNFNHFVFDLFWEELLYDAVRRYIT
jgi:hypothetical protein